MHGLGKDIRDTTRVGSLAWLAVRQVEEVPAAPLGCNKSPDQACPSLSGAELVVPYLAREDPRLRRNCIEIVAVALLQGEVHNC